MDDKETIIDVLKSSGEPMNTVAISKATGIDKKIISDIIGELKKEGTIYAPKRCFYSIA